MGRGMDADYHKGPVSFGESTGLQSISWQFVGMANSGDSSSAIQPTPAQAKNSWQSASLDFGTAEQLYKTTENSTHPFNAAEIAMSGIIAGVERNEYGATSNGAKTALDGDANAPVLPNQFLHPFDSVQQSKLEKLGVDLTNYKSTENSGSSSTLALPGNFGSGSTVLEAVSMTETPSQTQHDVIQELSQTGSAGVDQTPILGDCWFEAALASVASTSKGQTAIASMITQNKDHSYTVKFPGEPDEPVDVSQADIQNLSLHNTSQWANILEAANHRLNPIDAAKGASLEYSKTAIQLLTGNSVEEYQLTNTDRALAEGRGTKTDSSLTPTLAQSVQAALAVGDPVQAANTTTANGTLTGNHMYSVLSWRDGVVTLRNPGGFEDADGKHRPEVGQTINGVTNLGGGIEQMSSSTFMNDVSVLEVGRSSNS
jgi:hypothetical protein